MIVPVKGFIFFIMSKEKGKIHRENCAQKINTILSVLCVFYVAAGVSTLVCAFHS